MPRRPLAPALAIVIVLGVLALWPRAAAADDNPAQPGPAQPGPAQPGPAQPGPAQAAPAEAPPPDAASVEEARRHFATGQELFEAGNLKGAVEELKEAYRLSRNPLLLYNIAVVYDRLGEATLALHYFQRFIDEQKDTEKTHGRLVEASKRAAELRQKTGEAAPPPVAKPAPAPPAAPAFRHEPIEQAPPGRPIDVTARVTEEAGWVVSLFYRRADEDLYKEVRMKARPGLGSELVARIPATAVKEPALHYYIAARNGEGKVVASSGRAATPNIVTIDRAAPLHAFVEPGDEIDAVPVAPPPQPVERSVPRSPLFWAKWGSSAGAVALIGTGIGLSLAARSYADQLQSEATKSRSEDCSPSSPPCRVFSTARKDLEQQGQTYARWGTAALIGGAAVAAGAGILWYLDSREEPVATPMIGPGTVGASAKVRF